MKQFHNSLILIFLGVFIAPFSGCGGFSSNQPVAVSAGSQPLPFSEAKPLVIPADSVIYVHLKQPLTAADAEAGQDFPAVLAEPLRIDSQIVAPQGSEISGKVVAARESGHLHKAGYVRIRLSSIAINGKQLTLATNSVIAAGGEANNHSFSFLAGAHSFRDSASREAGFTPAQRLAFRLTQPLNVTPN